ncbi:hypothetical protein EV142_10294 [Flavobacterium circumlabens]|uniref:Hydrolase n=1 Tax=Flavobacterium circumlabens TaxID=2133765 RepID=A0ABY2B0Z9_9FLAO|nr:hypothetical protein EV142_10294 [Flavobacterium circumlabens]
MTKLDRPALILIDIQKAQELQNNPFKVNMV